MDFVAILAAVTIAVIAWTIDLKAGIVVTAAAIVYFAYKALPIILAVRGKKAYGSGNYEKAYSAYTRAVNTGRASLVIRLEYSDLLMQMGKTEAAKSLLDKMLREKLPADTAKTLKLRRCMAYYKLDEKEEALSDAEEIYNDGFRTTYLYALLGMFKLERDGKSPETFSFCKEAYNYNESDRDIADNYALALYYKGKYERARGLYNVMIKKYPEFTEAYYHGAMVEYALGDYKKAIEYLEKTEECKWSALTTVSKEEASSLKAAAEEKLGVR